MEREGGSVMIRGLTVDEYLLKAEEFHTYAAPGVIVGGFMVELACREMPEGRLFNAVSETGACLPDAIQLLTPCTIGNGWLRIVDTGRMALVLYDKETGEGVRVSLDLQKLEEWPVLKAWAMKLKPKKEQDEKDIRKNIIDAGTGLYKVERVKVDRSGFTKKKKIFICDGCGESFRDFEGGRCAHCSGEKSYYRLT